MSYALTILTGLGGWEQRCWALSRPRNPDTWLSGTPPPTAIGSGGRLGLWPGWAWHLQVSSEGP